MGLREARAKSAAKLFRHINRYGTGATTSKQPHLFNEIDRIRVLSTAPLIWTGEPSQRDRRCARELLRAQKPQNQLARLFRLLLLHPVAGAVDKFEAAH